MKKIFNCLPVVVVLFSALAVSAQQKLAPSLDSTQTSVEPSKMAARVDVPQDVQQSIATSQANVQASRASLEAAQLRLENLILRLRLALKVPDDFELRVDEKGTLYFGKAPASQSSREKPAPQK